MGLLSTLLTPSASSRDPNDGRWWTPTAEGPTQAGVTVNAETALRLSAVWACVRLLSETVAMLPLLMFVRLTDGGRERAPNHPLYDILHRQPNRWQTAFEFKEMLMGHVLLRGNGYAEIVPGPRGAVDQLIPLHPDRVTVERLEDGRPRYKVREVDGRDRIILDEDMFHLRGPSFDGLTGVSVITYARESLGLGLAAEAYGARFFGNDSRPGGVLQTDKELSDKAAGRLAASWKAAHAGVGNSHKVAVLEDGVKWQQMGVAPEDAQFLQTREFTAEDIARWFRVSPHMIGVTSKATSWGTGIEQLSIGFVIYTLLPWLQRWEQAIDRDLIIAGNKYFAEFLVDTLLRGDTKSRYEAYQIARNIGTMSANDVRRLENQNPIPNGDIYLQPLNMGEAGKAAEAKPGSSRAGGAHYQQLTHDAAARVVRKEIAAMTKAAKRTEGDSLAWAEAVESFYREHAPLVAETLHIGPEAANSYVGKQLCDLIAGGPAWLANLEASSVSWLVQRMTEEHRGE